MTVKETITPAEAGRRLGMTQGKVQEHIRDGAFWFCVAAQESSGRWRYIIPKSAFERFMQGELQRPDTYLEALRTVERLLREVRIA